MAKRLNDAGLLPLWHLPGAVMLELKQAQLGVSTQTLIRWRREYGGLRMDQAKRLRELENENARLKRLLADAELDKAILKEAASGNF